MLTTYHMVDCWLENLIGPSANIRANSIIYPNSALLSVSDNCRMSLPSCPPLPWVPQLPASTNSLLTCIWQIFHLSPTMLNCFCESWSSGFNGFMFTGTLNVRCCSNCDISICKFHRVRVGIIAARFSTWSCVSFSSADTCPLVYRCSFPSYGNSETLSCDSPLVAVRIAIWVFSCVIQLWNVDTGASISCPM